MIQLLIAAVIVAMLYFIVLGGGNKVEEKPQVIYQQQVEKIKGLEQSMQQAVDQKMRAIDSQTSED